MMMTKEAKEEWLEECRKADLEIEKQYAKENKQVNDKSKERKKKYYQKNKDKILKHQREYQREYYKNNKEKCKERKKSWYMKHKKEVAERKRAAPQKLTGEEMFNQILNRKKSCQND